MTAIIWYEDQNHVPRVRKIPELVALHLDWTGGRIVLDAKTTSDRAKGEDRRLVFTLSRVMKVEIQ